MKPLRVGIDGRNLVHATTGIGRYVHEMSRQLVDRGHDVFLYLPEPRPTAAGTIAGAHMHVARMPGPILRQVWAQTLLVRALRRDRLDIFWGPAHRLPPMLPRSLPRVVTIHDLVWLRAGETMHWRTRLAERAFMRQAVARADMVVSDSMATKADLLETIPGLSAPVVTIYPGVTGRAASAGPRPIDTAAPYVLFVGTLEPRKNLVRLLDAWQAVPAERRGPWSLVIVGGRGWGGLDLPSEIDRRQLGGSVRLAGYVDDAALDTLYAGAGLLAMPSLYEGFGLPIVEANAHGVPALTSNLSSMPEVAGTAGIIVDPRSLESLTEGLMDGMRRAFDPGLRAAARNNAARFDWLSAATQLEGVFAEAIAGRAVKAR